MILTLPEPVPAVGCTCWFLLMVPCSFFTVCWSLSLIVIVSSLRPWTSGFPPEGVCVLCQEAGDHMSRDAH